MAIFNNASSSAAQQAQLVAACETNPHVRLIAGPGSGKSRTILLRLEHLISQGVSPAEIYVISFTRASAIDLRTRVTDAFAKGTNALVGSQIADNVSTMHSLALKLLASANLLASMYPAPPVVLDRWQQENIFDTEFSTTANITPKRAKEVRAAYDAHWQTLSALNILGGPTPPSPSEQTAFDSYYPTAKSLYSCLLPGEVVRSCVNEINQGNITSSHLPGIKHLIVDEYQDLNNCDQEFVDHLAAFGANIFVAGDDDQSVYSFRHAAPNGIVNYLSNHPNATSHNLQHCFRCTPAVLSAAGTLISHSPARIQKNHVSMYQNSTPPVSGGFNMWRCPTGAQEAQWIAESCRDLVAAGIQPNQILILLRSNKIQGQVLYDALDSASVQYEPARADSLLEEEMPRLVHSLLEVVKNPTNKYVPYRVILGKLHGVGKTTCTGIANRTVATNLNFRDLFYLPLPPKAFTKTQATAIDRVASIISTINGWSSSDTFSTREAAITQIGSQVFSAQTKTGLDALNYWKSLVNSLQPAMTLDELYSYLDSETEAGRFQILDSVAKRLSLHSVNQQNVPENRVRVLTMHGAKGLEGQVVFIPGAEQGIIPSSHTITAAGLLNEERRLMYTAITRTKACCIVTLAVSRMGTQAFNISRNGFVKLPRSQFVSEIGTTIAYRSSGLTQSEIANILANISNL